MSIFKKETERFIDYGGNQEERATSYAINQRRGWQAYTAEEGESTHHMTDEEIRAQCNGDEELIAQYYTELATVQQQRRWGEVNVHPAIARLQDTRPSRSPLERVRIEVLVTPPSHED